MWLKMRSITSRSSANGMIRIGRPHHGKRYGRQSNIRAKQMVQGTDGAGLRIGPKMRISVALGRRSRITSRKIQFAAGWVGITINLAGYRLLGSVGCAVCDTRAPRRCGHRLGSLPRSQASVRGVPAERGQPRALSRKKTNGFHSAQGLEAMIAQCRGGIKMKPDLPCPSIFQRSHIPFSACR